MAKRKPSDKLTALEKQQAELAKKIKAQRDKITAEAKAAECHKAEIVGAVVLKKTGSADDGSMLGGLVRDELEKSLTKNTERVLFGLTPLAKEPKPATVAAAPAPVATPAPSSPAAPSPFFPAKVGGGV